MLIPMLLLVAVLIYILLFLFFGYKTLKSESYKQSSVICKQSSVICKQLEKLRNIESNHTGNINKLVTHQNKLQDRLNRISSERDEYKNLYFDSLKSITKLSETNVSLESALTGRQNLINYYQNKYPDGNVSNSLQQ